MPKSPSRLVPSTTLLKFLDQITSSCDAPLLDAPSGFGRNAFALAERGCDVIAVDRDVDRLRFLESSGISSREPDHGLNRRGRIFSLCADLSANRLPFAKSSFSAVICVHYAVQNIVQDLSDTIKKGGFFYIETFGGQGANYLELPRAGEVRDALKSYDFYFYKERPVGPPSHSSVVVTALGQKRL
jgi:SAM-dependent methyltransferase